MPANTSHNATTAHLPATSYTNPLNGSVVNVPPVLGVADVVEVDDVDQDDGGGGDKGPARTELERHGGQPARLLRRVASNDTCGGIEAAGGARLPGRNRFAAVRTTIIRRGWWQRRDFTTRDLAIIDCQL
jgi:hypothetical protein